MIETRVLRLKVFKALAVLPVSGFYAEHKYSATTGEPYLTGRTVVLVPGHKALTVDQGVEYVEALWLAAAPAPAPEVPHG